MPEESKFLPMLSYILKEGNVTWYQWKHGEPPNVRGGEGENW